jgi:iron-sulfur cluster assembly protein
MSTMPETTTTTTTEKVSLTEKAVEQIRSIQERENLGAHVLRVSVVGGGCSGMSYRMGFVESANPTDHVIERDGVKVVVDPKSLLYLTGTTIDFQDGLQGKGFTFGNPNAKRTCGCGSSFSG